MIHKPRKPKVEDSWHLPVKLAKAMKLKLGHNFQHVEVPMIHYVQKDDDGNIIDERDVPVTAIFGKELIKAFETGKVPEN